MVHSTERSAGTVVSSAATAMVVESVATRSGSEVYLVTLFCLLLFAGFAPLLQWTGEALNFIIETFSFYSLKNFLTKRLPKGSTPQKGIGKSKDFLRVSWVQKDYRVTYVLGSRRTDLNAHPTLPGYDAYST